MGNKKKFDKIEINDAYYETHADEQETETKEKDRHKKERKRNFTGLDAHNVPEKKEASSRFKYKRQTRKVVYEKREKTLTDGPSKAVFVYSLVVLCLVLVMRLVMTSSLVLSLDAATGSLLKVIMYVCAFLVPTVVYLLLPSSGKSLHNIKPFSVSLIPFSASCLGLLVCLAALQKYLIAYVFSYSEPTVATGDGLVVSILVGALLPAVCEELFVRGVLQYEVSKYAGGFCGVLAGSLVFAMLHFELQYFMIYFVSGIVLGCVTHVTRSVFPAMLVHFLNNTIAIVFADKLSFVATERIGGTLLIIVLCALCFGFLILTLHLAEKISDKRAARYLEEESKQETEPEKDTDGYLIYVLSPDSKTGSRLVKVLTNPPMLIVAAIFVVVAFAGL